MNKNTFKILVIIGIVFVKSCKKQNHVFIPSSVFDSIPTSTKVISANKMFEGGYDLIGVSSNGNDFRIENLESKNRNYLIKTIKYYDSLYQHKNQNEIEELLDNPPLEVVPHEEIIKPEVPESLPFQVKSKYKIGNYFDVFIDTSQTLSIENYWDNSKAVVELEKGFNGYEENYELEKQFLSKYHSETKNFVQAYPLFVFNRTDSIVEIDLKEGRLIMIQEAKNEKNEWLPIEYNETYIICGNSMNYKNILPNYYVLSKVFKYKGAFKTKLRVKLYAHNKIYYSNEIEGTINLEQFEIPKYIVSKKENQKRHYFLR